jgi:hypothetical protein
VRRVASVVHRPRAENRLASETRPTDGASAARKGFGPLTRSRAMGRVSCRSARGILESWIDAKSDTGSHPPSSDDSRRCTAYAKSWPAASPAGLAAHLGSSAPRMRVAIVSRSTVARDTDSLREDAPSC